MTANVLPSPLDIIVLPDDVLSDIYNNIEADQAIMLEQSGIYE